MENKAALRAFHAFNNTNKMQHRDPSWSDVDIAFFQWFTAARAQFVPVSGEIMKAKVEELAVHPLKQQ